MPKVSIDAHAAGLDVLVGLTTNKKANDVLLFQPQPAANLTGVGMMGRSKSVTVCSGEIRGLFRSPPKPRKSKKKSSRPAWTGRGERRGDFKWLRLSLVAIPRGKDGETRVASS